MQAKGADCKQRKKTKKKKVQWSHNKHSSEHKKEKGEGGKIQVNAMEKKGHMGRKRGKKNKNLKEN